MTTNDDEDPKVWGDQFTPEEVAALERAGVPMPAVGGNPDRDERFAQAMHSMCETRWARLTPARRAGTTFHGWEAHLPTAGS